MKKLLTAVFMLFMVTATMAQKLKTTDIVGVWEAEDKTFKLEMFQDGAEYKARMLYGNKLLENDGKTFKKDLKNPDEKIRSRSIDHIVFLSGLTWDGEMWDKGKFYDATSGKTYKCRCKIEDDKLLLRGYMGIPALGQTITMKKVK